MSDASARPNETSLIELLSALLRRWSLVVGIPLVAGVIVAIITFVVPPTYTATTTFVPEARTQTRLPASLAGLAGLAGLSLGGEASESPRFYADLVKSREILEQILLSRYEDPRRRDGTDSTTLLRVLGVGGDSRLDSLHNGVKKLDKLVGARVYTPTNIVRINVDARDPIVAAAVANRFVTYLNDFNSQSRQSRARERRKFIELRLTDGETNLREAETNLRVFYERNRSWEQAPQLVFEEGRLRRQVEIRQEVYLTLRREYETARIEEVNDTPVITVIDRASPPQERSKPKRILWVAMAFIVGVMVAVTWAALADYFDRAKRRGETDYQELAGLVDQIRGEIRQSVSTSRKRPPEDRVS